MLLGKRCI